MGRRNSVDIRRRNSSYTGRRNGGDGDGTYKLCFKWTNRQLTEKSIQRDVETVLAWPGETVLTLDGEKVLTLNGETLFSQDGEIVSTWEGR